MVKIGRYETFEGLTHFVSKRNVMLSIFSEERKFLDHPVLM